MSKQILLFFFCFTIISCSNNFEKISKDPAQISSLKTPINKANFLGTWRATNIVIPDLEKSFFNTDADYETYVQNKEMMSNVDFEQENMRFVIEEGGKITSIGPRGTTKGTYTLDKNIFSFVNENVSTPEKFEIMHLKNDNLILRSNQPASMTGGEDDKVIVLHLIMKRQ